MRECNGCTMCCTTTRVIELSKPERKNCIHCDNGCSIYNERPNECATFQCLWSMGDLPEKLRPDRCGVIIEKFNNFLFAMCDNDEWTNLHTEFKKFTDAGVPIVINTLSGNHMVLPEDMEPSQVIKYLEGEI